MAHHNLEETKEDLDLDFIARAEKVTSFNLDVKDFKKTTNKLDIQYLYAKNVLNGNFDKTISGKKDMSSTQNIAQTNKIINNMKGSSNFEKVYREAVGTNASAFGPGELMFYLIFDEVTLGGSASGDIRGLKQMYELKSANLTDGSYTNINFGTNVKAGFSDVAGDLVELAKELDVKDITRTTMNTKPLQELKKAANTKENTELGFSKRYDEIIDKFVKTAKDNYIKNHSIIILRNDKGKPDYANIKKVIPSDISEKDLKKILFIKNVTGGTMKPAIKL